MHMIETRPILSFLGVYLLASLFTLLCYGPGIEAVQNIILIATGCLLLFIYAYYFDLLR